MEDTAREAGNGDGKDDGKEEKDDEEGKLSGESSEAAARRRRLESLARYEGLLGVVVSDVPDQKARSTYAPSSIVPGVLLQRIFGACSTRLGFGAILDLIGCVLGRK